MLSPEIVHRVGRHPADADRPAAARKYHTRLGRAGARTARRIEMPMEHKAVGHSCLAAFFYYFANAQFPMRGGNVCESVLANGCQTGFLPILFTVANWTKWEQPTNFPVTANAVLFVGGAFPGVSLASLAPPRLCSCRPYGACKSDPFLDIRHAKTTLFVGGIVFNRVAVKGLQPWVQRSRGAAERNPRRDVPHCL